jgi:murein DD-endopeptidase
MLFCALTGGKFMAIKWDVIFENEKRQFENMSELDKFIYFLLLQFGSPYSWGKETPEGSDCSGAVCLALYAATGLLIRTTADDLYRRVFAKANPRPSDIRAVFYLRKEEITRSKSFHDFCKSFTPPFFAPQLPAA